jgi:ribosomal protein S18 acetylase RimI-like enzyme
MTTPTPFLLRLGIVDDAQAILPLMAAFNAAEHIAWRPEPMGAALRHLLQNPNVGLALVACEQNSSQLIGYGLATFGYDIEFAGPDAFVTELFVSPEVRGRGLGRQLLDALIERLRERGTSAAHLVVRPENTEARTLYRTRGFAEVPRLLMTKLLREW